MKATKQALITHFSATEIRPNPHNPRGPVTDEDVALLVTNIQEHGILQPLTVTPGGLIVIGHRRYRAGCLAQKTQKWDGMFPCIVREYTEREQMEIMMVENIQREELNPIQEAQGYAQLIKADLTMMDLVRRLNVPYNRVQLVLSLLDFPDDVQQRFARYELPLGAAKSLAKLDDEMLQSQWATHVVASNLSVRALEKAIASGTQSHPRRVAQTNHNESAGPGIDRATLVASLERQRGQVSMLTVLRAVTQTTCACSGQKEGKASKDLCRNCPFAGFLSVLVREIHDARS